MPRAIRICRQSASDIDLIDYHSEARNAHELPANDAGGIAMVRPISTGVDDYIREVPVAS